jgi:hypothetical protein
VQYSAVEAEYGDVVAKVRARSAVSLHDALAAKQGALLSPLLHRTSSGAQFKYGSEPKVYYQLFRGKTAPRKIIPVLHRIFLRLFRGGRMLQ